MRDLDSEPESVDCLGGGYRSFRVRYREEIHEMAPNPKDNIVLGRSKSKSPPRMSMHAQMRMERGARKRLNFSNSSNSLKSLQMVLNQESLLAHRRASQPFDAYDAVNSRDAFPDSLSSTSSSSFEDDEDEQEDQLFAVRQLKPKVEQKPIEPAVQDFGFVHLDIKANKVINKKDVKLSNGVNKVRERVIVKTNGVVKSDQTDSISCKKPIAMVIIFL